MLNNFIAEGFIVCFFSPSYSKELQQQILKKKNKKTYKICQIILWENIDNFVFSSTDFQSTSPCSDDSTAIKVYTRYQIWPFGLCFLLTLFSHTVHFEIYFFFATLFEHLKSLNWVHLFA